MKEKLNCYFNQMAFAISKIRANGTASFSEREFNSILKDKNNEYMLKIKNKIPEFFYEDNIYENELTEDFFSRITELIIEGESYLLLLLLYYMDRAIAVCYGLNVNFEDDIEEIEFLNSNYEETHIILLKKVSCKWGFRRYGNGIRGILNYFYFIVFDPENSIKYKNYSLDSKIIMTNKKSNLRIAISPLTKEKVVVFSKPYERENEITQSKQYWFRVEKLMNENYITELVRKNIYVAGEKRTDILVFPEMLGTRKMLNDIITEIQQNDISVPVPPLIIFPSIWEKTVDDLDNTNKSAIILNGTDIIFEQDKRCDFKDVSETGEYIYEDINRNRKKHNIINTLHIEGIGRLCIVICFDYIDIENRECILKNLQPTLICTPSFSTGSHHFMTADSALMYQECNWVWCNTCSAIHETKKEGNFKTIGIITKLSKNCDSSNLEAYIQRFDGVEKCKKEQCDKCVYYADISLKVKE